MNRTQVINRIIKSKGYTSYLEIGCGDCVHFNSVECKTKVSVDPNKLGEAIFKMTSDEFFRMNKITFDIIFIDGLHEANQVYTDNINSLAILNEGGTIVCHDMLPTSEAMQCTPRVQDEWTGDCWKAFVMLRKDNFDLEFSTLDTDYGIGIIQKGENDHFSSDIPLTYENFVSNRENWMNVIDVKTFRKIYK